MTRARDSRVRTIPMGCRFEYRLRFSDTNRQLAGRKVTLLGSAALMFFHPGCDRPPVTGTPFGHRPGRGTCRRWNGWWREPETKDPAAAQIGVISHWAVLRPKRASTIQMNSLGTLAYWFSPYHQMSISLLIPLGVAGGQSLEPLVAGVEVIAGDSRTSFETANNEFGSNHNEKQGVLGMAGNRHVVPGDLAFAMMAAIRPSRQSAIAQKRTSNLGKGMAGHNRAVIDPLVIQESAAIAIKLPRTKIGPPAHIFMSFWRRATMHTSPQPSGASFSEKRQL